MPIWGDVGDCFADQMKGYPKTNALDKISAFSQEFSRVKTIEQLRAILHVDDSQPGKAHLSFANLPFDIVITTNFDFLLERAYDMKGKLYRVVVEEEQLPIGIMNVNPGTQNPGNKITQILKIHGDFNYPNRMVITEEDYDLFLQNNPLMSTYVANLLITRTPLFIGYSLDDPDFRAIWTIIGSRLGRLRRSAYTLKIKPDNFVISRFERRGIKVITLGV